MTAIATAPGAANTSRSWVTLNRRKSLEVMLWFLVTAGVLLMMWLQMRNSYSGSCNLYLSGDSTETGAQVFLDGRRRGVMSASSVTGLGGSAYYGYLSRGKHEITVVKPGFVPFGENLDMHGEAYIDVQMSPQRAGNSQG